MFDKLPKQAIFAHRGSSAYAPENTLAAFEIAVQQKADAIEFDTKLSLDRQVVVFHDNTLDRTTDGSGKIRKLPLEAIKELDAGVHFDLKFMGEKIPTLDEVFEAVGGKIFMNVELANYESPTDALAEKVADAVKRHGLEKEILFSSFNPLVLRMINKRLPKIPIGLLTSSRFKKLWTQSFLLKWIPYQALHPEQKDVSKSLVNQFHKKGIRIHTYTVNQADKMLPLFQMGVDGIITDDPLQAQKTLAKFKQGGYSDL